MKRSPLKRKTPIAQGEPIKRKAMSRRREPKPCSKVQKGTQGVQKGSRWRSPRYLAWVRTLPCCVCGRPADSAHHLIGMWGMSGMGLKAPDSFVMPLCDGPGDTCHRLVHSHGHLRAMQSDWMRQTIRAGLAEFGGDQEIREALTHALVTIEAREST